MNNLPRARVISKLHRYLRGRVYAAIVSHVTETITYTYLCKYVREYSNDIDRAHVTVVTRT